VRLHVTNGDSAVPLVRAADPAGHVVPWRDVLHDGPVPGGLSADALAAVRAEFLAGLGWASRAELLAGFGERDAVLARAGDFDEVVLWFEHDLYDQLQLIQVVDRLCCLVPPPRTMTIICRAEYLGAAPVARGPELFGAREPLTAAMTGTGRLVWGAFTAPAPGVLDAALRTDLTPLPFLRDAMRRLCEEYPWTTDGLSRMERQALQAVAGGAHTRGDAFRRANRHEDPVWCGDLSFFACLDRLARGRAPLLALDGERVTLTGAGAAVLNGASDAIELNGIDRWLGGVHLAGPDAWRWNPATQAIDV
jgi:hypothetical protein